MQSADIDMPHDFDTVIERRGTAASKWTRFSEGVLPFWVADMDFRAPEYILNGLRTRLDHGILGYTATPPTTVEAFVDWLRRTYAWEVREDWLVWIPGVVTGFNLATRAALHPGGGILIPKPVYYPFLDVPKNTGGTALLSDLVRDGNRWVMDMDDLDLKARQADILLLCNPQNPTGRVYTRQELEAVAALCERRDLVLMSDEIHCPLVLDPGCRHLPIASLHPDIAARSITLFSPTKAYNLPGLGCGVAVIPDRDLRRRFMKARAGLVPGIGPLAYLACELAWRDQTSYLPSLLAYLRANHDQLRAAMGQRMTPVEGTYLAWIDITDLGLADPEAHFVAHGLGLSQGAQFGGPGYIRFNFGCPSSMLQEGIKRLKSAFAAA
ncbi:MAG: putative C-S lyase [Pseudomonadales bacterium]|nr:putative C-S lyase [Pseudomonadales bacterium]